MTATLDTPSALARDLEFEGGFSVNPRTGQAPVSGYAVSTNPECNRQFTGRVTAEDIRSYAFDHAPILVTGSKILGAWLDTETGITHLDVSTVVYDRSEALALARKHGELAVWDVARGIELRTAEVAA
ncbi:hypothetical protein [Amycolatopsis sp.]|uniref:hypothetical protein n=1 Tax=Amycolatopsis sp. TaxID=37632 RepID=UPI002D00B344|nr:hypothetical protein [Amycolatopsis sp.]HVV11593.1 hypothetical protein [Amycolatopsis sp.]